MLAVAIGAGRLGADVGGVITVGAGAAVAALLMLPGGLTQARGRDRDRRAGAGARRRWRRSTSPTGRQRALHAHGAARRRLGRALGHRHAPLRARRPRRRARLHAGRDRDRAAGDRLRPALPPRGILAPLRGGRRRRPRRSAGRSPSASAARCSTTPGPCCCCSRRSSPAAACSTCAATRAWPQRGEPEHPRATLAPETSQDAGLASPRPIPRHSRPLGSAGDAHRPGVAVFVDVSGGRDAAHRGPGRAAHRGRATTSASSRPSTRPTAVSARLHRGAAPQARELPEHLVPLGRTVGIPANGAVSNLSVFPSAVTHAAPRARAGRLRRRPRPRARRAGWSAGTRSTSTAPRSSATFHSYGTNALTHGAASALGAGAAHAPPARPDRRLRGRRLDRRGASSAAATGSSPTASTCPTSSRAEPAARARAAADRLRRPGRRAQGPAGPAARLRGAARARRRRADDRRRRSTRRSSRCCSTRAASRVLGRVSDEEKNARAARAPTCCARRRSAARASAWS